MQGGGTTRQHAREDGADFRRESGQCCQVPREGKSDEGEKRGAWLVEHGPCS